MQLLYEAGVTLVLRKRNFFAEVIDYLRHAIKPDCPAVSQQKLTQWRNLNPLLLRQYSAPFSVWIMCLDSSFRILAGSLPAEQDVKYRRTKAL